MSNRDILLHDLRGKLYAKGESLPVDLSKVRVALRDTEGYEYTIQRIEKSRKTGTLFIVFDLGEEDE